MKKSKVHYFGLITIKESKPKIKDYTDLKTAQMEKVLLYPEMKLFIMIARSKHQLKAFKDKLLKDHQ